MAEGLRRYVPVLLLLAVPALLPFGAAAGVALLAGAVWGSIAAVRGRIDWRSRQVLLATVLFAGYWLPELVSAIDAVDARRSWKEVAADLRYLPFLWFAVLALATRGARAFALRGLAAITAAFALDGLLQALTGISLGGAGYADRLSGIFGADNLKLGPVLAVLSPVLLLEGERRGGRAGLALCFALLLPVLLLAGSRAGWVGFALALGLVLWHRVGGRRALAWGAVGVLAAAAVGTLGYLGSERFAERVDRTAALLRGDREGVEHALAGRLRIFEASLAMIADHPVNGVGVRGFRAAYPDYAGPDDPWVGEGETAMHPHQIVLEVGAETGGIGLLCWLAAAGFAWRAWRRAPAAARDAARAPAYALVVMLFPLNTHLAVHSSFWALLLFALLGLFAGALRGDQR